MNFGRQYNSKLSQSFSVISQRSTSAPLHFTDLPEDVIILAMHYLTVRELASLARTCMSLYCLVNEVGWSVFLRCNPWPSFSSRRSLKTWDAYSHVRYRTIADRNWIKSAFVARPLSRKWTGKLQPVLAINTSRLVVGAGVTIYSYVFTTAKAGVSPGIRLEGSYTTSSQLQARRDITSIASVPDGGMDRAFYVGYADGGVERVILPHVSSSSGSTFIEPSLREKHCYHGDDVVESISSSGNYVLSLSSGGTVAFMNLASSSFLPQLMGLGARSWSSYLSTRGSTPYAVLGTSSVDPLVVHSIYASELSSSPTAVLSSGSTDGFRKPSAVYGISGAPLSSPWGSSDQIVVSGWYDGLVHVHDMRSSARLCAIDHRDGPSPLRPVLSVYDPWTFEPNYCVACGGGSSSFIAAGTARHSVVALWDVRSPAQGWSVHAPGNDSSPVYSIVLESARLFGATQSRPFVLDFGAHTQEDTYPSLSSNHREEGLKKRDRSGAGFYVTKYTHSQ
ncbi:uncharacterized protein FIBRA_01279 [Fibroporia radiculosa]|uniref:F-box domain-containing protein n=1 Tax=Fibroporia radiculosa TaxID=599839 RepID=J4H106_9APHY|nr:uncharacterized protein FIBRA_01279 [Fibroporia radiculosa]CCL99264.1 predicted protein [Fibroporia radiculosa]